MPQTRGFGPLTRRFGVVATAAALVAMAAPAVASGAEGALEAGSTAIPEAANSVGQVLGSVAPLEAVGSTGGSAAASVASSGSLPGSVYANPTGSVGSGTIGLGSVSVPEYIFPVLSLQFMGGFFTALSERQQAAELFPHELTFWHDVVIGSAEGGTLVQAAADDAGAELPAGLAGSIESVQQAALEDPFEKQEQLKAELAAEAAAEEAGAEAGTERYDDGNAATSYVTATEGAADLAIESEYDAAPALVEASADAPSDAVAVLDKAGLAPDGSL